MVDVEPQAEAEMVDWSRPQAEAESRSIARAAG